MTALLAARPQLQQCAGGRIVEAQPLHHAFHAARHTAPAGFEIDNPGLVSSANLGNFPWLESTQAAHLEFRNDRFVAAFDRSAGTKTPITLAYVVRAVTPGLYTHPAATVEDMYRPQFAARTATGMMEVAAP